jgi:hypothetical protein
VDRLVHQRERIVRGEQVPDPRVQIHGLDRIASEEVDGVQRLTEAQQVLVVHAVADAPAAVEI